MKYTEKLILDYFRRLRPDLDDRQDHDVLALHLVGLITSLEMLDLLLFIEHTCGISLDETQIGADTFGTIQSVVRFVEACAANPGREIEQW